MKSKITVLLSVFIWGSGQFFLCKRRLKGLIFFAVQLTMILTELFSGYWIEWLCGYIPNFSIRLHAGFFVKGVWGVITLGENTGGTNGDHSTMLLINGVITIMILLMFLFVFYWNLKDASRSEVKADNTTYKREQTSLKNVYQKYFPYFIVTPIGIAFLFVVCMPILFTFLTSFLNYNRDHLPPGNLLSWIGVLNFKKLFTIPIWSHTFLKVLLWTIIWTLVTTFATYFLGMFQAMILNHPSVRCKKIFRTIFILPWAVPQMVTLLVFRNLLNGQFSPVNQVLLKIGVINSNIPFLSNALVAKATVIVVGIWLGFPMFMVMMLGVLSNIERSLYEAAALDGAGKWQEFQKITFPLVMKATAPNLIMSMAANFNGFGMIYFLTQGGPTNSTMQFAGDTDILISWIYKLTLNQQMYDIAAVMSVLLFLMIGSVSFWNFRRTTSFQEL